MMIKNKAAFAKLNEDCKGLDYKLQMKPAFACPLFVEQHTLSDKKKKYLAKWIEKMKMQNIISRSEFSRWNHPAFIIQKEAIGEYRLVSESREFNKAIPKDYVHSKSLVAMLFFKN